MSVVAGFVLSRANIPFHQNNVRLLANQSLLYPDEHPSGLFGMASGAHIQIVLRLRQLQLLKEDPVHVI